MERAIDPITDLLLSTAIALAAQYAPGDQRANELREKINDALDELERKEHEKDATVDETLP